MTAYAAMLTSRRTRRTCAPCWRGRGPRASAIDTEMRWTLLTSMAAAGVASEAEITAERERDNTSTGREREARALAVPADR